MEPLPAPEVIRRYVDEQFHPPLPALNLRWPRQAPGRSERLWYLPEGVCLEGPAPESFGVSLQRTRADSYRVRLLWDRTIFSWPALTRVQLLTSALAPLMGALDKDLRSLLEQPVKPALDVRPRIAA